ncbi:MAG: hypothetical protein STSR0004_17290 [Peptococcaceae bacterium]
MIRRTAKIGLLVMMIVIIEGITWRPDLNIRKCTLSCMEMYPFMQKKDPFVYNW